METLPASVLTRSLSATARVRPFTRVSEELAAPTSPIQPPQIAGRAWTTKAFYVDSTEVTWQSYWNLCQNLSLSTGQHLAWVRATDVAGNSSAKSSTFYCY